MIPLSRIHAGSRARSRRARCVLLALAGAGEAWAAVGQSALEPAGPQAESLHGLTQLLTWVCAGVWLAVMLVLALAVLRRRSALPDKAMLPEADQRRVGGVVAAAVAVTVAVLFGFLVASLRTDRALAGLEEIRGAVTIRVTGKQWWWEVYYEDSVPANSFVTANEIHIPVGRPVLLKLHTADVIHSLWIPSLNGKKDAIPGRENELWVQADRAGVFVGQCAEFCGLQHAHMALRVVAEPVEAFELWRARERANAAEPASAAAQKGRGIFLGSTCVMCHTVRGTPAGSRVGPDLTHFASRRTIAAGARPNERQHLELWVQNPQAIKPGTAMPMHEFKPDELAALVDFLEGLR